MKIKRKEATTKIEELDFNKLFNTSKQANKSPLNEILDGKQYKTTNEAKNPSERQINTLEGQTAKKLYFRYQREEEDHERSLAVYQQYQENIKISSQLQTEILKGIKEGKDIYSLFLKAVKAISLMTSDNVFYEQVEKNTIAIYGEGLLQKEPLQKELENVQKRLKCLKEAKKREVVQGAKDCIEESIKAHEKQIAQIKEQINHTDII